MKCNPMAIKREAMKRTVDGIIDILLRMHQKANEARINACDEPIEFEAFCKHITTISADEFYSMELAQKGEINERS